MRRDSYMKSLVRSIGFWKEVRCSPVDKDPVYHRGRRGVVVLGLFEDVLESFTLFFSMVL